MSDLPETDDFMSPWPEVTCVSCGEAKPAYMFPGFAGMSKAHHSKCGVCVRERDAPRHGAVASRPSSGSAAPTPPLPQRVLAMIERRSDGYTLDEIGREFGVTRERVRQLIKKHDGPDVAEVRRLQKERTVSSEQARVSPVSDAVRAVLLSGGPMTAEEVASSTGLAVADVGRSWPGDLAYLRLWASSTPESRWSDDDVLEAIREAAIYAFPLTATAYTELIAVGQVLGPSAPRISQRFGTWTAACEAAGVTAGRTVRINAETKWSNGDLLDIVQQYLLDPAAPNSAHRFDQWKRENVADGPSCQTIRNRFGSWTEAKRRALTSPGSRT